MESIKNDAGLLTLALRLVVGWTYFSALWRRTALANKLDPESAGYLGEKFNHFLPNALGIQPIIQYLVENPDVLWLNMVVFTIIEGIVGLAIMLGLFTRLMSIGVFGLAFGILLGSGWIGTTCLDEWQIGILGIATGFVLFLTGSGRYSLDYYLLQKDVSLSRTRAFTWLASGPLPLSERLLLRLVLGGALFIFSLSLFTNQVFHGGLWGPLHNKSVKPKIEITGGRLSASQISFEVFRTEGVDVYGAWMIEVELLDAQNQSLLRYGQAELSNLPDSLISNFFVAKVKASTHSLLVPLGAKARITLPYTPSQPLSRGAYTLRITDISGAYWEHVIRL